MSKSIWRMRKVVALFAVFASSAALAQTAPAAAAPAPSGNTTGPAIAGLRPALGQVGDAVGNLRIMRWKAPTDLRESTQGDVISIQRDLSATLPPLLDQAQANSSPTAPLAPAFAIFRNIDALYDVLLRVSEMASLSGSSGDANQLEAARATLESARAQLANALLESVVAQDTQLIQLRAQLAAAAAKPAPAPAAAPSKLVVDDGPEPPKRRKKRPTTPSTAPATPPTAPATPHAPQ
ncbi:MAG TPA: hypothetical protein VGM27_29895 [Acidobacteriaceae bacterium]